MVTCVLNIYDKSMFKSQIWIQKFFCCALVTLTFCIISHNFKPTHSTKCFAILWFYLLSKTWNAAEHVYSFLEIHSILPSQSMQQTNHFINTLNLLEECIRIDSLLSSSKDPLEFARILTRIHIVLCRRLWNVLPCTQKSLLTQKKIKEKTYWFHVNK